ncbi:hypothetical protein COF09_28950 [Bacillus toyonensis]|uniref:hypothetical protein n=1 Tax=Bacillus toyonensis TaxID=155322 RepID=UPI000BFD6B96|nr:hypothetical protein [Bacillus toyonensis]PHC36790.1 hypothetical protein COF09_28950 [Bacillus toyonensis]
MITRRKTGIIRLFPDEFKNRDSYVLVDERGYHLKKEEVFKIIEEIKKTYENDDINEIINFRNKETKISQSGFDFERQGRYVHSNMPVYKFKEFNKKSSRVRKMECTFCGRYFTSETQDGYYKLTTSYMFKKGISNSSEEACSEICIRHIWDELLNEWLKKEGLEEYIQ